MDQVYTSIDQHSVGLLVIDVQEKLFATMPQKEMLATRVLMLLKGSHLLGIPSVVSEQYPKGLGPTIPPLRDWLFEHAQEIPRFEKSSFSCLGDQELSEAILSYPVTSWIVVGLEAHVCVLQTARDLVGKGKKVILPIDATSSRTSVDRRTAIGEMRTMGVRITTCETILFELLGGAQHPLFKSISQLVK